MKICYNLKTNLTVRTIDAQVHLKCSLPSTFRWKLFQREQKKAGEKENRERKNQRKRICLEVEGKVYFHVTNKAFDSLAAICRDNGQK